MTPKLLLADDSVTIQRVIELTFADENVQVVAVGDGKQAIDRIQSDRPDIVLADVGMPERDGYEVAAFIKGNPQLAHIPVLLLTGAFEPIDEARARSVGCDGVLVKPFEPQMVISRVRDLLTGSRRAAPWQPAAPSTAQPGASASTPANAPASASTPPQATAQAPPRASGEAPAVPELGDSLEDYFDRLDAALATKGPSSTPKPVFEPVTSATPQAPPAPAPPGSPAVPLAPPAPAPAAALPPNAQAPGSGDPLDGWDPDLAGSPARQTAPQPAAPPAPPPRPVPVTPPAAAAAPRVVPSPSPAPVTPPPAPAAPPAVDVNPPAVSAAPPQPPPAPIPVPSLPDAFAALLAAEQGHPAPPLATVPVPQAAAPALSEQVLEEIVSRVIARMGDESMRRAVLDAAERLVREEIDRIKQGAR